MWAKPQQVGQGDEDCQIRQGDSLDVAERIGSGVLGEPSNADSFHRYGVARGQLSLSSRPHARKFYPKHVKCLQQRRLTSEGSVNGSARKTTM